jgi:hypothetical protein
MPMTLDAVDAFASTLPGASLGLSYGHRTWKVDDRGFAWHRPFSKADIKRFENAKPPEGDILAVRVESLDAKEALLAIGLPGFFTIPHFNGYAGLLIALKQARPADVKTAITEAYEAMRAAKPKKATTETATRPRATSNQRAIAKPTTASSKKAAGSRTAAPAKGSTKGATSRTKKR